MFGQLFCDADGLCSQGRICFLGALFHIHGNQYTLSLTAGTILSHVVKAEQSSLREIPTTLTTLGYGDITGATSVAKNLSVKDPPVPFT